MVRADGVLGLVGELNSLGLAHVGALGRIPHLLEKLGTPTFPRSIERKRNQCRHGYPILLNYDVIALIRDIMQQIAKASWSFVRGYRLFHLSSLSFYKQRDLIIVAGCQSLA